MQLLLCAAGRTGIVRKLQQCWRNGDFTLEYFDNAGYNLHSKQGRFNALNAAISLALRRNVAPRHSSKLKEMLMKTIIAGSRSIGRKSHRTWDYDYLLELLDQAVVQSGFQISEVISGRAGGTDRAGEKWAESRQIPVNIFKPNWKIGKCAGLIRNREMVAQADALIAIFDGASRGTLDTISQMQRTGKFVHVIKVSKLG